MNLKEKQEYIEWFKQTNKFGQLLGYEIISLETEECIAEYVVRSEHFNPNGILHGGALYGVMDSCQGLYMHYIIDPIYKVAATGTATIKYFSPLGSGRIRVRTYLKERQTRKYFINSEAHDESGKLVASVEEIWIALAK